MRRPSALILSLLLAVPRPSPAAEAETAKPEDDLLGTWIGSGVLQTEGPPPCRYEKGGVTLTLARVDADARATVALEFTGPEGCAALKDRQEVSGATLGASTAAFTDASGRAWNLAVKEGTLKGIVSGTALSGEVTLRKSAATTGAAGGSLLGGAAGVVAANVVGIGIFLGVNRLAKDEEASGDTEICSPRKCTIIASPECDCNGIVVTGQDCGPNGPQQFNQPCNVDAGLYCDTQLSCNNERCEDLPGSCPLGR